MCWARNRCSPAKTTTTPSFPPAQERQLRASGTQPRIGLLECQGAARTIRSLLSDRAPSGRRRQFRLLVSSCHSSGPETLLIVIADDAQFLFGRRRRLRDVSGPAAGSSRCSPPHLLR